MGGGDEMRLRHRPDIATVLENGDDDKNNNKKQQTTTTTGRFLDM
jgi:hypothetical protein